MSEAVEAARRFIAGEHFSFAEADGVWRELKAQDELSLARLVVGRLEAEEGVIDGIPSTAARDELCQQHAFLTSKDPELSPATRHDMALDVLHRGFKELEDEGFVDPETLGIAGGIHKRRWRELGQLEDLRHSGVYYQRAARGPLGQEGYSQINAAFVQDLLAAAGDDPENRRRRARELRERIVGDLEPTSGWWNAASRAEAHLGLGNLKEATAAIKTAKGIAPWKLQTTARQLAELAHLHSRGEGSPLDDAQTEEFFRTLLGDSAEAMRSAFVGKVGLALSGGGFRASFYHLGVLARLAELGALRHIEVLSCVSGGSIVGAYYWLGLRKRLLQEPQMGHRDYVDLVSDLIGKFEEAVATDLRSQLDTGAGSILWRFLKGERGALDPSKAADILEETFFLPLAEVKGPLFMHDVAFTPLDHDAELTGSPGFNPRKHNWLRANNVPALVINATTINTGHAWHFTPTWMGESPWSVHEAADSVPRLEWAWYRPESGWQIRLAEAVAASAAVPGLFSPLRIPDAYDGLTVELVDGGVYDNQGTTTLLAQGCNVILVSDAAGQLKLQRRPQTGLKGLGAYARRSMDTLMERIRQSNYADLAARLRTGLIRGLMLLHMKAGLDADPIRLSFSQASFDLERSQLSPSGVRRDFQSVLGDLRTDLDAFTEDEARYLMACGYCMTERAVERELSQIPELVETPIEGDWVFSEAVGEITSTSPPTDARRRLLDTLTRGSEIAT